jgi:geranylgeranylglycerol-phosphate geranylgeranyltransferase
MDAAQGFQRLIAPIVLIRPGASMVAATYVIIGAYIAAGGQALISRGVYITSATLFFVVAFGFAVNDLCDVETDRIGKPERPLPSGRLSRAAAVRIAYALAIAALALSMIGGKTLVIGTATSLVFGAAYSIYLKNTVLFGNILMALLAGSLVLYGSLSVSKLTVRVLTACILLSAHSLAYELLYTLEDEKADRAAGVRTFAVEHGARATRAAFIATIIVASALGITPWVLGLCSADYVTAFLLCAVLPNGIIAGLLALSGWTGWLPMLVWLSRVTWVSSMIPSILIRT